MRPQDEGRLVLAIAAALLAAAAVRWNARQKDDILIESGIFLIRGNASKRRRFLRENSLAAFIT
jgi:hypothetical protein